jgi:hypothetical protein
MECLTSHIQIIKAVAYLIFKLLLLLGTVQSASKWFFSDSLLMAQCL